MKEREAMCEILDTDLNTFSNILQFATIEPFNFLFCDLGKNPPVYYRNLDQQIVLK
jgi:hypothetical protein